MLKCVARSPTLEKSAKRRLIFANYAIQISAPTNGGELSDSDRWICVDSVDDRTRWGWGWRWRRRRNDVLGFPTRRFCPGQPSVLSTF